MEENEEDLIVKWIEERKKEEKTPYIERDTNEKSVRIGSGLKLREDFYSAMFLYYFNVNYILEDDPEDVTEKSINDWPKQEEH